MLLSSLSSNSSLFEILAQHFLGVEFRPFINGYFPTEGHYIASILKRLNMSHCKPLATPSPVVTPTSKSATYDDPAIYRSVVGALQYLNMTRPDIAFAVNQACRSMHSPQSTDWVRLKHLLWYLKGTIDYCLHIKRYSDFSLTAYSDADWAGNAVDCRPTSGFLVFRGSNLIS